MIDGTEVAFARRYGACESRRPWPMKGMQHDGRRRFSTKWASRRTRCARSTATSRAGSSETPPDVLASRRAQAEYMFRRIGITFGVYGDKDAAERLIPFDIVPRLISRAEWTRAGGGPHPARHRAQSVPARTSTGPRAILKEDIDSARTDPAQSLLSAGDDRPPRAARHLGAYRRHRHRARRRRRVLRAGGQRPHALRRLLHAGEPRSDDAADAGSVRRASRRAGRRLSRRAARLPALGRAARRRRRGDDRAPDARARSIPPITSTRSSPTSSASNWSRAAICSSTTNVVYMRTTLGPQRST